MLHDHRGFHGAGGTADDTSLIAAELCAARANRIMSACDPVADRHALIAIEICDIDEQVAATGEEGGSILSAAAWQLLASFEKESFLSFSNRGNLLIFVPEIRTLWETAKLVRTLIAEPLVVRMPDGRDMNFCLRAGMAAAPHHGTDFRALVDNAELALCDLRRRGQWGLLYYEPHYRRTATARSMLRQELLVAEREQQFVLHYQPQVNLRTGCVVGVEALIRWQHPSLGLIGPVHFLEELEEMPIAARVGDWVFGEAVRQSAAWLASGHAIRTAVNIFSSQLTEALPDMVEAVLDAHALPSGLLEVEITERLRCDEVGQADTVIKDLRRIGIGVALDDFGTGFATLNAIRTFDVSRLKIDRSFVSGMLDSRRDGAIVAGLLDLGRETGLSVIAEGVERQEQLMALTVNGCDEGQGALFGMPMPPELITAMIDEGVMPMTGG